MPLIQVVYASAATRPFRDTELALLLSKARVKNADLGVSGLLLYHEGSFLQVLEGESRDVDNLYAQIGRDPRHSKLLVLARREVAERTFADWRMGFAKIDPTLARELPAYVDFFGEGVELKGLPGSDDRAILFLRGFRFGRWRQHVEEA